MNTLSIFLYLANVIPNLAVIFIITATIIVVLIGIATIATAHHNDLCSRHDKKPYMPVFKWLALPVILGFLAAIIPSERTMYMIAASELGEVAVMNEEVQEVFDALKERILIELRPQENTNN